MPISNGCSGADDQHWRTGIRAERPAGAGASGGRGAGPAGAGDAGGQYPPGRALGRAGRGTGPPDGRYRPGGAGAGPGAGSAFRQPAHGVGRPGQCPDPGDRRHGGAPVAGAARNAGPAARQCRAHRQGAGRHAGARERKPCRFDRQDHREPDPVAGAAGGNRPGPVEYRKALGRCAEPAGHPVQQADPRRLWRNSAPRHRFQGPAGGQLHDAGDALQQQACRLPDPPAQPAGADRDRQQVSAGGLRGAAPGRQRARNRRSRACHARLGAQPYPGDQRQVHHRGRDRRRRAHVPAQRGGLCRTARQLSRTGARGLCRPGLDRLAHHLHGHAQHHARHPERRAHARTGGRDPQGTGAARCRCGAPGQPGRKPRPPLSPGGQGYYRNQDLCRKGRQPRQAA